MRIPIWPGVRLTVWEKQDPKAVHIRMHWYHKPFPVWRVLSKRGWALFLVRYDWRDHGQPERVTVPEPPITFASPPPVPEAELEEIRRRAHP